MFNFPKSPGDAVVLVAGRYDRELTPDIGTLSPSKLYVEPSTDPGSALPSCRYVSLLNPLKKCVPVPFTATCAKVDPATNARCSIVPVALLRKFPTSVPFWYF